MAEALQNQQWVIEEEDISGGAPHLFSVLTAVKQCFTFLFGRVSEVSNFVREALLHCTLLYVWMVCSHFKGYKAGGVEETSLVSEHTKVCSICLPNNKLAEE